MYSRLLKRIRDKALSFIPYFAYYSEKPRYKKYCVRLFTVWK
nr:MAG TPA: hypothetical protein [Caudoviricetes sp.]